MSESASGPSCTSVGVAGVRKEGASRGASVEDGGRRGVGKEGRKEGKEGGRGGHSQLTGERRVRACVRAHTTTEACRQAPKRWVGKNSRERAEGRSRWVETHPVGRDACMRTPTDAYKAGAPTRPTPAGRAAPGRAPKKEFDSRHVFASLCELLAETAWGVLRVAAWVWVWVVW